MTAPTSAAHAQLTLGVCALVDSPAEELRSAFLKCGSPVLHWYETVNELIDAGAADPPDLVVLGARRPDPKVLRQAATLLKAFPSAKTILVCARCGIGDIRKALDLGARGIVLAAELDAVLFPVLQVVHVGQISVPGSHVTEAAGQVLTSREKQILGLVVMGMSNPEIAAQLFVAESTVKSHLSSAFGKLGVSSRSEAAAVILDPASGVGAGILTIPTSR